jgi:hypothetical protein
LYWVHLAWEGGSVEANYTYIRSRPRRPQFVMWLTEVMDQCIYFCHVLFCQWLATGRWFSPISSTNKTDCHDIIANIDSFYLWHSVFANIHLIDNAYLISNTTCIEAVVVVIVVDLQLPMQSVPITTDVVSSNLDQGEVTVRYMVVSPNFQSYNRGSTDEYISRTEN